MQLNPKQVEFLTKLHESLQYFIFFVILAGTVITTFFDLEIGLIIFIIGSILYTIELHHQKEDENCTRNIATTCRFVLIVFSFGIGIAIIYYWMYGLSERIFIPLLYSIVVSFLKIAYCSLSFLKSN
jgi:hypothetical protein